MPDDFRELELALDRLGDIADALYEKAAVQCIEAMRNTAVMRLEGQHAVDTGNLVQSVRTRGDYRERSGDEVQCGIETDVPYGLFIEYGTGTRGDPEIPHVPKDHWWQADPAQPGHFILRFAQFPRPFMRPAVDENIPKFEEAIMEAVAEAWSS